MYSAWVNLGASPQRLWVSMESLDNWCTLPTSMGDFRMYDTGDESVRVITMGDIRFLSVPPLVRIHSSCLASEVFGARDCDCGDQLRESMKLIATEGSGLIIHLHQEGRGQGLSGKIRAVRLMESNGLDTVQAFEHLGLEQDTRTYESALSVFDALEIESVRLISNNPRKQQVLEDHGIKVIEVRTHPNIRPENEVYLHTKNDKLGHRLPLNGVASATKEIRFYHSDQPWGDFSNFSPHAIFIEGLNWRTVEHFYQAMKFNQHDFREMIRLSPTPTIAKSIASEWKGERRDDWGDVKEEIMLQALRAKYTQHPELGAMLLDTKGLRIVESTSNDAYWGEDEEGNGLNRLGELLMQVRIELES